MLYKFSSSKKNKEKTSQQNTSSKVEFPNQTPSQRVKKIYHISEEYTPNKQYTYQSTPTPQDSKRENIELIDLNVNEEPIDILGIPSKEAIIVAELLKRPEY